MAKKLVGKITHYYPHVEVAVVELTGSLKKGDKIEIEGRGRSFEQVVKSMQVEHKNIATAKKGQAIGLKVDQETKNNDLVYKL